MSTPLTLVSQTSWPIVAGLGGAGRRSGWVCCGAGAEGPGVWKHVLQGGSRALWAKLPGPGAEDSGVKIKFAVLHRVVCEQF